MTSRGVIEDHARFTRSPYKLVPTLLRSQSVAGREILAYLASEGRLTSHQIESSIFTDRKLVDALNPRFAGPYARVLAHQLGDGSQEEAALELLDALIEAYGQTTLDRRDVNLYAQLLGKHRRRQQLLGFIAASSRRPPDSGMTSDIEAAMRADAQNPFIYPADRLDEQHFLSLFNSAVDPIAPPDLITLNGTAVTPFDRLSSTHLPQAHGPLITVVTSAFNPGHALLVAARSLIRQTWQNWEMIIVDDASTDPNSDAILVEAASLDDRIRVIRKPINGGTYRARNTALMQSRGAFMTFLDSDDWAHPLRLELGVRPMLEYDGIVATRSYGIRATEDLELSRPGYRAHFTTAAALMIRTPAVPTRIGFFDPVRKAADTEYTRRIEVAFGRPVYDLPRRGLTIVRRSDNTLSSNEFSYGWRHQARWAYKQSYAQFHQEISAGAADPFVDPLEPSAHFGTHYWARPGDPDHRRDRKFDVVLAGDWRRFGGPQISMLEEISALRASGLRVGVMHLEAMRFRTEKDDPLCRPLRLLLEEGAVDLVYPDDDAEISILILRYPPILQFPPVVRNAVQPRKLFIMANQAPAERDGSDQRYVPADVHRAAKDLFGVDPQWIPQSAAIRSILQASLPAGALTSWDNPGIIAADQWHSPRQRPTPGRPVIGRFSRDTAIKFPDSGHDLLAAYGLPPHFEVRMLGATNQVARLLAEADAEVPENWTVLEHGAIDPRTFVAGLDVVVYMDNPTANEAFGRVLLESAASGALVIASPKHQTTFGDALVYAEPNQVSEVLHRYLENRDLFDAQVALTRRRVLERWSHSQFVTKIRSELPATEQRDHGASIEVAAPSGELTLKAAWNGLVSIISRKGNLKGIGVPLRRPADAELADSLVVVHTMPSSSSAERYADDIRSQTRPGALPQAFAQPLPQGVHAIVHFAAGEWTVHQCGTALIEPEGTFCRISFS